MRPRTRSVLYTGMKENMGPPGSKVKLKETGKKSKITSSEHKEKENTTTTSSIKPAKMPLVEKNVAQIVTIERRLSVREGAKKSADKITEFCRKIKNTKSKDKENDCPQSTPKKRSISPPTQVPAKLKAKGLGENKPLAEERCEISNITPVHVFASPQAVTQNKTVKTGTVMVLDPPVRRLSIREGARKSKDKIAEICKSIKNSKTKNPIPQKFPDHPHENEVLKDNTTAHQKAGSDKENLLPKKRLRKRQPALTKEQSTSIINASPKSKIKGKKDNNKKAVEETPSVLRPSRQKCAKPVLQENHSISNNNKKMPVVVMERTVEISKPSDKTPESVHEKESYTPKSLKRKLLTSPLAQNAKRIINNDFSFRVLDEKKSQGDAKNKEAVYDFTFDPSEEPPPQKKKRKQVKRNKPKPKPQPKPFIINNNYDQNILKKLQTLKETVNKKTVNTDQNVVATEKASSVIQTDKNQTTKAIEKAVVNQEKGTKEPFIRNSNISAKLSNQTIENLVAQMEAPAEVELEQNNPPEAIENVFPENTTPNKSLATPTNNSAHNEIEDIEAQWAGAEENEDLNYSPARMSFNNVLSSTLNTSVRQPQDSPWRPDFETLPFKWQTNSHIKPNMTPAVETSFVISDKKHVYTNMLQEDDTPPEIEPEKETSKMKQSSILSFIEEVTERTTRRTRNQKKLQGPSRANLPRTALNFAPSADVVNKLYDDMKAATDAPQVPERNHDGTNIEPVVGDADEGSVHLFEDIDVVHHLKPTRKSYGKAKKLTFCKTVVDNTAQVEPEDSDSDAEKQALDDMTFELPNIKTRKPAKKKKAIKLTKKEEEEVEAWAAAFNSMCEDVEDFPLLTE